MFLEDVCEHRDGRGGSSKSLPERGRRCVEAHVPVRLRIEYDDVIVHGLGDHVLAPTDDCLRSNRHWTTVAKVVTEGTLFGYGVRSAFSHGRLSGAPPLRGEMEIGRCAPVALDPSRVTHHDAGTAGSLLIARDEDGSLVVVCSHAGGFRIDADAMRVLADRSAGSDEIWEHRLVTVIVPLLLAEKGDVALHAAAVARGGRAVVFAGVSTRGKSTLALAAASRGLGVLADDGVVIDPGAGGGLVWPGPDGVRVARPGEARKETHRSGGSPLQPASLAAIAVLGPWAATEAVLEPVAPVEAVPALVPSLIFSGHDRLPEAMRNAAWLASTVPVFRCRMPLGVDRLPAALAAVLDRLLSREDA